MPWDNSREARQRSDRTYKDPEYLRNRAYVKRRANGRCEGCGRRNRRLQCDHIIPVAEGGGHDIGNLQMLCSGPGSCHSAKTARMSKGGRVPKDPDPLPRTWW
jgi:5-methylcytosine-specific restriction protein A